MLPLQFGLLLIAGWQLIMITTDCWALFTCLLTLGIYNHQNCYYRRGTAWRAVHAKSFQLLHSKGHSVIGIASIRHATYHFLLVVCSNNDSLWHCFRDITTFIILYCTWLAATLRKTLVFAGKGAEAVNFLQLLLVS